MGKKQNGGLKGKNEMIVRLGENKWPFPKPNSFFDISLKRVLFFSSTPSRTSGNPFPQACTRVWFSETQMLSHMSFITRRNQPLRHHC